MYVYKQTEPNLFTVGYYQPGTNKWEPDSDHPTREEAAKRVAYMNGETIPDLSKIIFEELKRWQKSLSGCITDEDIKKEAITLNTIIHKFIT